MLERLSIFARLAIGFVGLVVWSALGWSFVDLAQIGYGTLAFAVLAVTAKRRPVRWVVSAAAVGLAVHFLWNLPDAFPLDARLRGARFVDVPVAEVLRQIARQKDTPPDWRFYVVDEMTAARKVSLGWPAGASLREALDAVTDGSGCVYRWSWFRSCGNDPRPSRADFRIGRPGGRDAAWWDWPVVVDRHRILHRPPGG